MPFPWQGPAHSLNSWGSNVKTPHCSHLPMAAICAFCHMTEVSGVLWSLRKVPFSRSEPPGLGTCFYSSVDFDVFHPHILHLTLIMPPVLCSSAELWAVRSQLLSRHLWSAHCELTPLLLCYWCQVLGSDPILSWGPYSNPARQVLGVCVLSCVWLLVAPWTVARQAPLSMKLPRQEHWSGLSSPPLGDLPDPGIKPTSPVSPAL